MLILEIVLGILIIIAPASLIYLAYLFIIDLKKEIKIYEEELRKYEKKK